MSIPPSSVTTSRPSNLTVPATQNTAPVVKFRCLFTHDMRRKAKRWQDGFLRYHTFNKRVMVYDTTGYFIGDLHWRAPEGIQDGDELELDKGVLIQVCEPLEKTETDLSSLYKNKTQPSPSRPSDPRPSSIRSTRPLPSQQAPRSLNDLLGIKKTSTPQVHSSHEQRDPQKHKSTYQLHERPTKRQRTSPGRVNSPAQEIVDLSDSPSRRQSPGAGTSSEPPRPQPTTALPKTPEASLPTGSSAAVKPPQPPSDRPTMKSGPQTLKPARPSSGTSVATLRLTNTKPRKKLMYQETLAPIQRPLPRNQLSRSISQSPTIQHETSSPVIVIDDDSLDTQPIITREAMRDTAKPCPPSTSNAEGDLNPPVTKPSLPDGHPRTPHISSLAKQPSGAAPKPRSPNLRKSYSDPTTIDGLPLRPLATTSPLNPITKQNDEHEQGPWTSEALDLFEFWPPGRPKPP
ncbi:hypothetical protein AN7759.2 [Aspergillus nidulans FGSC A4]|nr:hypothetical protein AN7759.2 [Aspergillus nidulans FGSC A4]|eukprot:XP_681028.1 hypothetical protein AN7759.2 [Aspergillus nidulans FGSC A4]